MIPICTAGTVRARDHLVITDVGIPGRVLMELAGRRAAEVAHAAAPGTRVAVLCGGGNNGGDGFVVARWLALWGHTVRVWCARPPTTADGQANLSLLEPLGIAPCQLGEAMDGATIVVDALLGTGQRSAPRGAIDAGVRAIQAAHADGQTIVSLDLPTGVCGDTGVELGGPGSAVRAHQTITFGYWKPGLLCAPGAQLAGAVTVVDLGLCLARSVDPSHADPDAWLLTEADVQPWLARPHAAVAKWDRGHVAVRAGGGAAVLACLGAFAAGAGMVTLLAPRSQWASFHGLDPSVILAEPDTLDVRRHDALIIGPGLGLGHGPAVQEAWASAPIPVLADADALTLLARSPCAPLAGAIRVITPHAAEAARLLGSTRQEVNADRFGAVRALERIGTPVLKGPHTLIGGGQPWVSPVADGRLAVAGSGDVLSGCIGAALARGLPPRASAALGVWLHGAATDHLRVHGTAGHLVDAIRVAVEVLHTRSANV